MHDFTFHSPTSLEEAFDLLDRHREDARLIAGGTALLLLMKQRLTQPRHLISLAAIAGLDRLEVKDGALHIGSTCSHRAVETSPLVQRGWPLLAETYRHVATVRIRNAATVGGGLAHADPNQDPPPSLIVLGASVQIRSRRGERTLPVEALATGYYETALQPGEVLTGVVVPPLPPAGGTAFIKLLPRTADDYATVSVAALVRLDPQGRCQEARVALGSAGPVPVRARRTEDALQRQRLTPTVIREAAELTKEAVDPLDDFRGSASYKRDMAAVMTRRALEGALQGAELGSAQTRASP
jgi:carbon-monoxide dehydrogenase medium subunit